MAIQQVETGGSLTKQSPISTVGAVPPVVQPQVQIPPGTPAPAKAMTPLTSDAKGSAPPAFVTSDPVWVAGTTQPKGAPLVNTGPSTDTSYLGPNDPIWTTPQPTAPSLTGTPTGSGGSGSGGSGGGGVGTGGGGGGGSSHDRWVKSKIDELMGGQFEWDPSKDEQYKQQSAYLLNQNAQEMVGRGGLYSSVNQMAGQQKLQDLQVAMREQRYNEWQQERQNTMQLITWIQAQDDRTAAKWAAQQASKLAANQSNLQSRMASNEANRALVAKYMAEWKQSGRLSNEAAAFLHTTPGYRPYDANMMNKIKNQLDTEWGQIQSEVVQSNYDEAKLGLVESARQGATDTGTGAVLPPSNADVKSYGWMLETPDHVNAYNTELSRIQSSAGGSRAKITKDLNDWLDAMTKDPAKYRRLYGDVGYKTALADVSAIRDTIAFNSSAFIG